MGAINNAFNKAGWSILALAQATSKYRSKINEEKKNRAKQSYTTAATIKKQNNELTQNQVETPKSYFSGSWDIQPEIDEQKIAEKKVLEQLAQEKTKPTRFGELAGVEETFKQADAPTEKEVVEAKKPVQSFGELAGVEEAPATSFGELPTVSAENSETNISAKDPEVQGLIEVKQKNALRAVAGKRSQERYQNIKAKLTGTFADYSYIDDVWREISLDPDVTDEMIRKAGFTKTQILEEWKWFKDSPSDWMAKQNIRSDEYWAGGYGNEVDAEDFSNYDFGGMLSAYIKAKAGGKTLGQQWEEHELSKAKEEPEEENYKVWQDESTEEEKDEVKTDRNFSGMFKFLQDESTKEESTEEEKEKEKDEAKTDRNFSGIKF